MTLDADAILVHQVHPVKLAFDISASVIPNVLLWQHRLAVGAWRRKPSWMLAGALLVAAGWSHGMFFEPISTDR